MAIKGKNLSLTKLVQNTPEKGKTPRRWKEGVPDVKVQPGAQISVFLQPGRGAPLPRLRLRFIVKGSDVDGPRQNYPVEVVVAMNAAVVKKPAELVRRRLKVYCGCPAFKYYTARALHKANNAVYKRQLGIAWSQDAPIRNPTHTPYICKHIVAVKNLLSKRSIKAMMTAGKRRKLPTTVEKEFKYGKREKK